MKGKTNARQKREADARERKALWSPGKAASEDTEKPKAASPAPKPAARKAEDIPRKSPEEEAREFLEYLEKYGSRAAKEEDAPAPAPKRKGSASAPVCALNLEEGMPTVEEAVGRMRMGLQEMRIRRVRIVKLIHGYGSTGRGGKIRAGVRNELAGMKRKKLIREFIPGEDFGPLDALSRKLVEQERSAARDPDYGRMNHGITLVVL